MTNPITDEEHKLMDDTGRPRLYDVNQVYWATYRALHSKLETRIARCERVLAAVSNPNGAYADDIRRCKAMYERMLAAQEQDQP